MRDSRVLYYYTTTTVKAIIHLDSHCLFLYYYSTDTKIGLVLAHFLIFHNLEPSDSMNNKKWTGSYKYDDEVALLTVRLNSSRLSKLRCVLFLCARILHDEIFLLQRHDEYANVFFFHLSLYQLSLLRQHHLIFAHNKNKTRRVE